MKFSFPGGSVALKTLPHVPRTFPHSQLGLFPILTLTPQVPIMELVPRKGVKFGSDFCNHAKGPWDPPKGPPAEGECFAPCQGFGIVRQRSDFD